MITSLHSMNTRTSIVDIIWLGPKSLTLTLRRTIISLIIIISSRGVDSRPSQLLKSSTLTCARSRHLLTGLHFLHRLAAAADDTHLSVSDHTAEQVNVGN